jgi:hypothetical protein
VKTFASILPLALLALVSFFVARSVLNPGDEPPPRPPAAGPQPSAGSQPPPPPSPAPASRDGERAEKMRAALAALARSRAGGGASPEAGSRIPIDETLTKLQELVRDGDEKVSHTALQLRTDIRSKYSDLVVECVGTHHFPTFKLDIDVDARVEANRVVLSDGMSRIRGGPIPRPVVECVRTAIAAPLEIDDQQSRYLTLGEGASFHERFSLSVPSRVQLNRPVTAPN